MDMVIVRMAEIDVPNRMQDMRIWLDAHRYEPSMFKLQTSEPDRVVEINFRVRGEAEAFAARFSGRLSPASSASSQGAGRSAGRARLPNWRRALRSDHPKKRI